MIRALISQSRGFAAFDDGIRLGFLDGRDASGEARLEEIEVAHKIAGATDLESIECADLDSLRKHLKLRAAREGLLLATLVLIDSEHSERARTIAAEVLTSNEDVASYEWVEGVLLSAPLPGTADLRAAMSLCPGLGESLSRLQEVQPQVQRLKLAWDALPERAFAGQSRQQALALAVRNGVFRKLIVGPRSSEGPFLAPMDKIRAELRLELENAAQELPVKVRPRASRRSSEPAEASLWKALPWQIAWRASRWPMTACILAENEASRLMETSLVRSSYRPGILASIELSSVYRNWHTARHKSQVGQVIDALNGYELGKHNLHVVDRLNILRSIESDPYGIWRSPEGSRPEILVVDMLLPMLGPKDLVLERGQQDLPKSIFFTYFMSAAHRPSTQVEIFDADALMWSKLRQTGIPAGQRESADHLDSLYQRILETYSLAQVLNRHGCIVYTLQDDRNIAAHSAVLVDPQRHNSLLLTGQMAWLVTELSGRLRRDLSSGLPPVESGWRSIQDIARKMTGAVRITVNDVRGLQRKMSSAGLGEDVIELRGEEIRLNPEKSATTALRK